MAGIFAAKILVDIDEPLGMKLRALHRALIKGVFITVGYGSTTSVPVLFLRAMGLDLLTALFTMQSDRGPVSLTPRGRGTKEGPQRLKMAVLVSAYNLRKAFAARPLFEGITFAVESGERIGLIGPNGAGKSTLLKILASQASADEGNVSFQRGLRVAYLEQVPTFKPGATVMETVLEGAADPHDWECIGLAQEQLSKLALEASTGSDPNPRSSCSRAAGKSAWPWRAN